MFRAVLNDFELDVARSLMIAHLGRHFGAPVERTIITYEGDFVAEMLLFARGRLSRFFSFGFFRYDMGKQCRTEFLLPVDNQAPGYRSEDGFAYLGAVVQKLLLRGCAFEVPTVIGAVDTNTSWPSFVLLDEARGEEAEVVDFHLGDIRVAIEWVVPLFEKEATLVMSAGIDALDSLIAHRKVDLTHISRNSMV